MSRFLASLSVGIMVVAGAANAANPVEAFYQGKRLTILVNQATGGPTDIEGRLFAKHLRKHLAGHPSIVVQTMAAAAGLVGAAHLGTAAPRDGTVAGYFNSAIWLAVTNPEKFPVDFGTYEFVAYQPGTLIYFMRSDLPPGIKVATDIATAQGLVAGGNVAGSGKDIRIRLALDMLGVPYKYATGYGGSQEARLAFERGEINVFAESLPAYLGVIEPMFVKQGKAVPLFYDLISDGETIIAPRELEGLAILPFHEFYQQIKGTMPSGPLWDAYQLAALVSNPMQRLVALPPDVPQAAVDALRAAVRGLNGDKDFAQEADTAIGFAPTYEAGPETNQRVRKVLSVPPETKAFIDNYRQESRR